MSIEVLTESGHPIDVDHLVGLSRFVLERMRVHPLAELCIKAVDEDTMAGLNEKWMEGEGPTDVLAFPMDELDADRGPGVDDPDAELASLLGDIVLCPAVAARQAATAGHSAADELHLLAVHGVLHLLGYDHAEPEEERQMFALQGRLLAGWRAQVAG